MFNRNFYPTPSNVIDMMLDGVSISGKIVLEPSAGRGDIVKRLIAGGAKNVIACEIEPDLKKIVQSYCKVVADDFMKVRSEDISHVDLIIMNPPFSNGVDHINHAFAIAPDGCTIIALCNYQTFSNAYSKSREQLSSTVNTYGTYQNIGDCFSDADRKTDVEVALVRINKPGGNSDEFTGFFLEDEEEPQANGIITYNFVRDIVNRYVASVKIFDEQMETAIRLNDLQCGYFQASSNHNDEPLTISISVGAVPLKRIEFKKAMQKSGWNFVFNKLNMQKYATKGLKDDINKFVETQQDVPFTMRNIYKMLEIVIGTTGQRMDRALLEVFDKMTKHHDENRYGVEGWKTNSHFLLGKRFIAPYGHILSASWDGKRLDTATYADQNVEPIEDLVKALCYITGEDYDDKIGLVEMIRYPYYLVRDGKCVRQTEEGFKHWIVKERTLEEIEKKQKYYPGSEIVHADMQWGQWFDWTYFRCKGYKKGTIHFEFKDEDVWAKFNQRIAKLKGYPLYEPKKQTKYQKRQTGQKETVGMA